MNQASASDLTSGRPLPHLQRDYAPGGQLIDGEYLAGYLRDAARECDYEAVRMESPPLRRFAAATGVLLRHLAQVAETPVEPVTVSTWFVVHTAPEFAYEGTKDGVTLTLTAGADSTTQLTFRIDPTTPVLERIIDLFECARTEYYRDKVDVDPDFYNDADAAPGQPGIPNATVTLSPDMPMNYEVDPIHDIVHLYFGSWSTPRISALRLDIRDPKPTLNQLLNVVRQIKRGYHQLSQHQHHFSGPLKPRDLPRRG